MVGFTNLYVTSIAPRANPIAVIQQVFYPGPPAGDFRLVINTFSGVKPNGANSPFPYGFNVEPDD